MKNGTLTALTAVLLLAGCGKVFQAKKGFPPPPPFGAKGAAAESSQKEAAEEGDEKAEAERESADDARKYFFLRRTGSPEGRLPVERYEQAREQISLMKIRESGFSPRLQGPSFGQGWTSLGPGNIGGRVRGMIIHPTNPSIIYVASATGGVWKTTDGGQNWNPLTDLLPVLNFGAIAMDPADPETLYAGSGEFYTGFPGQGIFKTTDAGATWRQLTATNGTNFTFTNKLVVSRANRGRVYAATSRGIFVSPDGGNTWSQTLSGLAFGCQDLALQPAAAIDYLFAACSGVSSAADYGIYRNTNAAGTATWDSVFTQLHMARTTLAIAPSQPSTIYALAASKGGTAGYDGGLLAVFRSTANGDIGSWVARVTNTDSTPLNTSLLSAALCSAGKPDYSQGNYDNIIAVDPVNPNRVWAGGVELFRSDDGGANWGYLDNIHPDHHEILFHPGYDGNANQTMFVGNDGGLFRVDNSLGPLTTQQSGGGCAAPAAPTIATSLNTSFVATQFYHGVAYPGGSAYMGGAQDNGVSRGGDAGGLRNWTSLFGGDGTAVAVDPADINSIFYSAQRLSLRRSTTNGASSSASTRGITEDPNTFPFVPVLKMDPNEGKNLFLGGRTTLWRTQDAGVNWAAAAPVEPSSGISAIAISPRDSNTVLFATNLGRVYRSSTALTAAGTTAWSSGPSLPGYVSSLAMDWANPGIIYATYGGFKRSAADAHVYKSSDGGATFVPSDGTGTGALPDIPANAVLVNPYDSAMVFVGTDLGLFVSTNAGASWARDPSPFSNVMVHDLVVDRGVNSQWLFAFTYGRGAYKTGLPGITLPDCTYSVTPTSIAATAAGGIFPVTVTTQAGCGWTTQQGTRPNNVLVQSPAQGQGPGTAYIEVVQDYFNEVADTVTVAGIPVAVTIPASFGSGGSENFNAVQLVSVPGTASADTRPRTSATTDPVHSCTGSADFKTTWWSVAAAADGALEVRASGRRYDVFGNYGVILSAYPGTGTPTRSTELACVARPKDTLAQTDAFLRFSVRAGATYLIEVSAPGGASQDGGFTGISFTMLTGVPSLTVTPATNQVTAGSGPVTFVATTANLPNKAVRWSISPAVGSIAPDGSYTPPAAASGGTQVTVTATSFAAPSLRASAVVTFGTVSPTISRAGIISAASFQEGGGVAPGQILTVFGSGLGPTALAGAQFSADGKFLSGTTGGTQVLFDGVPAPMIFSYAGQISAIAPYEIAGKATTSVVLTYGGQTSNAVSVPVVSAAPALFTAAASGTGQAAIFNHDGLPNAQYPEPAGQAVALYGTGEGQTDPPGVTGALALAVYPKPVNEVKVTIGDKDAKVLYQGAVPTAVAGLFQVNVEIPPDVTPGPAVPVVVTVDGVSSRSDVTMWVMEPDSTRVGRIAYSNRGTTPVSISFYRPDSSVAVGTVTVGANANLYLGTTATVANNWGVQTGAGPQRTVGNVCSWNASPSGGAAPYWQCTGTAAQPFPR